MHVRHPVWLRRAGAPGAEAFAILFTLESFTRALLATIIPIEALRHLGDAQQVSVLFFAISFVGVAGSFTVPWLVRRTARRWVYSAGGLVLIGAPVFLGSESLFGLVVGMAFRVLGTVTLAICLNLYIMDYISRRDFSRSEPLRLFYSAGAWSLGPFLGVYLAQEVGSWATYALSIICGSALLAYFWILRLRDDPALRQFPGPTPSPLRNIARYSRQPRLVLAWLVSLGRNVWWVMFFIYTPIYAVTSGLGELVGGLLVSAGTAFLFLMPIFGWAVRRYGLRTVMVLGFLGSAALTLTTVAVLASPWLVVALILGAALSMSALDASGNILFLAAVHPNERPEMTTVYSTYRDMAEMGPPGLFSLLLRYFELPAVFVASGCAMFLLAGLSRKIHPRLGRTDQLRIPRSAQSAPGR